jgi:hypothetical protein
LFVESVADASMPLPGEVSIGRWRFVKPNIVFARGQIVSRAGLCWPASEAPNHTSVMTSLAL